MKFLIVDNDPVFSKLLEKFLEKEGHKVSTAIDGLSALDILKNYRPDFIFVDYVMPNIDGGALCKILGMDETLKKTFIVVLSAVAAEEWSDCCNCGADAYIAKSPFHIMKRHILEVVADKKSARQYCSQGNVIGIDNLFPRGITKELLTSKKHYNRLLSKMSEGVLELNSEYRIVYANPSALNLFDRPEHEILGLSVFRLFSDVQKPLIENLVKEVARDIYEHEEDRTISFGSRYLTLKSTKLDGGENHFLIMIEDITDLKTSELSLRKTNNFLNSMLDSSKSYSIISTDLRQNILFWNSGAEKMFGYSAEEVVGKEKISTLYEVDHDGEYAGSPERIVEENKKTVSFEAIGITKGGEKIWVKIHMSPLIDENGEFAGIIGIGEDITEMKKMEEEKEELQNQILHARKSELIGTLAGGVAHDFNNLLMGIQGNISISKFKVVQGKQVSQNLNSMEESVAKMASLTEKLAKLAKGVEGPFSRKNVNPVVERSLEIFEKGKTDMTIDMNLSDDLWKVDMNEPQILQVFLNIFDNAFDAMDGKGLLRINTKNRRLNDGFFSGHGLRAGKYVEIEIADTGIGMDQKTIEKIFDPFFTTKARGSEKGSGLGLATVYATIKRHRGMIKVKSKPGEGAKFRIYLPAVGKSDKKVENKSNNKIENYRKTANKNGNETVLLIDDDHSTLDVLLKMTRKLGYKAIGANSGSTAVEIFKKHFHEIDLAILDTIMPDMFGDMVFMEMKKIDPNCKVMFATGNLFNVDTNKLSEMGCRGYLQKPFRIDFLRDKIASAIGG